MAATQIIDEMGNVVWIDPATGQLTTDPSIAPASFGYDLNPYSQYLQYVGGSGDVAGSISDGLVNQDWLSNPTGLFDIGYNLGNRRSLNPYYSPQIRDAMRQVASQLGLSASDADRAALQVAQQQFSVQGQGYTDATSPQVIANQIASQIYAQAGKPYQGLTAAQQQEYVQQATNFQNTNKAGDADAWKADDIGGAYAFAGELGQSMLEPNIDNPERAFLGAEDPLSTGLWNSILGTNYDPTINQVGGPTSTPYQTSQEQGINTMIPSTTQPVIDTAASMIGGGAASEGLGTGLEASGVDPAYVPAITGAAKAGVSGVASGDSNLDQILLSMLAAAATADNSGGVLDAAGEAYKLQQAYQNDNPFGVIGAIDSASGFGSSLLDGTKGDLSQPDFSAGYYGANETTDTSQPDFSAGYYGATETLDPSKGVFNWLRSGGDVNSYLEAINQPYGTNEGGIFGGSSDPFSDNYQPDFSAGYYAAGETTDTSQPDYSAGFYGGGQQQQGADYSGTLGTAPADNNNVGNLYAQGNTGTVSDAGPQTGGNVGEDAFSPELGMYDMGQGNTYDLGYNWNDPMAGTDWSLNDYLGGTGSVGGYTPGMGDSGSFLGGLGGVLGGLFGTLPGAGGTSPSGTGSGLAGLLAALGPSAISAMGAQNVANKYDAAAQRWEGYGAPYRDKLAATYADPNAWLQSAEVQAPVQQGTDALMRSLSVQGNPFGSGAALQQGQNYASNQLFGRLGEERNRLGQLGGLAQFASAAPGASANAADAGGQMYRAGMVGANNVLNQPKTLAQQLYGLV